MAYTCYKVNQSQLFDIAKPQHENVFASHITCEFGVPEDAPLPKEVGYVRVVGIAEDDKAQALIVSVDGVTERPRGGLYHITLSTADGVKPVYSNQMINEQGYMPIPPKWIDAKASIVNWN